MPGKVVIRSITENGVINIRINMRQMQSTTRLADTNKQVPIPQFTEKDFKKPKFEFPQDNKRAEALLDATSYFEAYKRMNKMISLIS